MIKFNQLRSFFSSNEKEEYNSNSHLKEIVIINPDFITAIVSAKVGGEGIWASSWEATRIYTSNGGSWLVEGNVNTVNEIICNTHNQ